MRSLLNCILNHFTRKVDNESTHLRIIYLSVLLAPVGGDWTWDVGRSVVGLPTG